MSMGVLDESPQEIIVIILPLSGRLPREPIRFFAHLLLLSRIDIKPFRTGR